MHAHNYCILHGLNVLCTTYYIGYLHYIIKAGCRDERSKGYYTFQLKVYSCAPACHTPWWLSATICWPTSDRPHKLNDRSHEVTDRPHQACVEVFNLSNGSLVSSRPHWIKWVRSLVPRTPPSFFAILGTRRLVNANTCLESAYARSPPYPSGWPYQNGGQYQC